MSERALMNQPVLPKKSSRPIDGKEDVERAAKRKRRSKHASRSPLVNLLSKEGGDRYYPIQQLLCQNLNIQDIVNVARTCKLLSSLYKRLVPTQWNMNARLGHFFANPQRFRETLGICQGVISGHFAYQFFERATRRESEIDIFVEESQCAAIHSFLVHIEGYHFAQQTEAEGCASHGVRKVLIYHRNTDAVDCKVSQVKIMVLGKGIPPAMAVLRSFYMTSDVNLISCNTAFAVFPRQTFVQRRNYFLNEVDDHFGKLLGRYEQLGWTSELLLDSYLDKGAPHSFLGNRWLGDNQTWTIPVTPQVQHESLAPDSYLECYNFEVFDFVDTTPDNSLQDMQDMTIGCETYSHPALKYQYAYADEDWEDFISERLDRLGTFEFLKCPQSERPPNALIALRPLQTPERLHRTYATSDLRHKFKDFTPPVGWKYYDKLMPQFRKEFLDRKARALRVKEEYERDLETHRRRNHELGIYSDSTSSDDPSP